MVDISGAVIKELLSRKAIKTAFNIPHVGTSHEFLLDGIERVFRSKDKSTVYTSYWSMDNKFNLTFHNYVHQDPEGLIYQARWEQYVKYVDLARVYRIATRNLVNECRIYQCGMPPVEIPHESKKFYKLYGDTLMFMLKDNRVTYDRVLKG